MPRLLNLGRDEMGVEGAIKFIVGGVILTVIIALISEAIGRFWPFILVAIAVAVGGFIFVKMRNRVRNTV
jgi:hypothetical protein